MLSGLGIEPYQQTHGSQCQRNSQTSSAQHQPPEPGIERWFNDPVAVYTLSLTVITFFLTLFTAAMWNVTRKAVRDSAKGLDLANKTYVAAHRPRLRIRGMHKAGFYGMFYRSLVAEGGRMECIVTVANIGGSTAFVTKAEFSIFPIKEDEPIRLPRIVQTVNITILAGRQEDIAIHDIPFPKSSPSGQTTFRAVGDGQICGIGRVFYGDEAGNERVLGFHRTASRKGWFSPVEGSSHEYDD